MIKQRWLKVGRCMLADSPIRTGHRVTVKFLIWMLRFWKGNWVLPLTH